MGNNMIDFEILTLEDLLYLNSNYGFEFEINDGAISSFTVPE